MHQTSVKYKDTRIGRSRQPSSLESRTVVKVEMEVCVGRFHSIGGYQAGDDVGVARCGNRLRCGVHVRTKIMATNYTSLLPAKEYSHQNIICDANTGVVVAGARLAGVQKYCLPPTCSNISEAWLSDFMRMLRNYYGEVYAAAI